MKNRKLKPVVAIAGAAVAASLSLGAVADETSNPFEAEVLEDALLADAHGGEGKCGEGEGEGEGEAEGQCGEGKCGDEGDAPEDAPDAPADSES